MAKKEDAKSAEPQKQQTSQTKQAAGQQKATAKKAQAPSKEEQLQKQVADLQKKLDDKDDQYLRAEAEIQNMTTRFNKERAQILKYDGQDLAKSILPVLDNLERALQIKVTDDNGKQLMKGIQMTHDHLVAALKDHGITEIEAEGKPFDPNLHQAVQTVPVQGDQKPDTVAKVLQAGYQLKDRVLRPSMVVVTQ